MPDLTKLEALVPIPRSSGMTEQEAEEFVRKVRVQLVGLTEREAKADRDGGCCRKRHIHVLRRYR